MVGVVDAMNTIINLLESGMIKKFFSVVLLASFLWLVSLPPFSAWVLPSATAQEAVELADQPIIGPEQDLIQPVISGENQVRVNKAIIFDASSSIPPEQAGDLNYQWELGDGTSAQGQEVVHTYKKSGNFTVTLKISLGDQTQTVTRDVFVYNKLFLLLTDADQWQQNIENLKDEVAKEGIYLFVLDSYEATTAYMSEEALYAQLNDNLPALASADGIAVWTTRGNAMNVLVRLVQQNADKPDKGVQDLFKNKTILTVTNENINTLGRILQGIFNILRPKQIVIARQYELRDFIGADSDEAFLSNLSSSISDYSLINAETGKISVWNSMSYLVSFMIAKGIPSNTIVLLLMLPIIATIIAILKQVVGITTFGLYTPSVIALSFLALGWQLGLFILFIIIVAGALIRRLLDRFNLLHIPRVAIILTFSTLIILLSLALGTYLGVSSIASVAVFPMLIMTTLAEKFVTALSGKGFTSALILMVETTVVSLICYWVVEWHYLQNLILGHPELILILLIFNYGLGRWTGLRLMEYVRFREVMKHTEE